MKVPLIGYFEDSGNGGKVVYWSNSKMHREDPPFKPYITVGDPRIKSEKEGYTKGMYPAKRLPSGEDIWIKNVYCDTEKDANKEKLKITKNERLLVGQMQYMDQMYIDSPDHIGLHPNTDPLKILTIDIEVYTDGSFPIAKMNPIICIGVKFNDEPVVVFDGYNDVSKDRDILEEFVKFVGEKDPDIITGYNVYDFDIPYIMDRCEIMNVKVSPLSRKDTEGYPIQPTCGRVPLLEYRKQKKRGKGHWNFPGRVVFDVWTQVAADQTIVGVPNKKLKTIARKFGLEDVIELEEEDMTHTCKLIGTDKLAKYQESDVRITKQLFDLYFPRIVKLAEEIYVPLEKVSVVKELIISDIMSGRELKSRGFVSLNDNKGRYHPWYSNLFGAAAVGKEWIKYQGAVVECPKEKRWFEKTYKVDFSSFYPNIMITFNLSPETVKITGLEDYTFESNFRFTRKGDIMHMSIPDSNFNKDIQIEVDMSQTGFMKEIESNFLKLRKDLKKKEKEAKKAGNIAEATQLYSQQWAYKVIGNAIYGANGQQYTKYGDLSVAIAVVGLARWMILHLKNYLGSSVIEIDTDGIYCDKDVDPDAYIDKLSKVIKEKFGVESTLRIELDKYNESYFYKAKNYVLRDENGDLIFHGATMKSSSHFPGYKKMLNKIAEAKINNDPNILKLAEELEDFDKWELEDFTRRVSPNRDLADYDMDTNMVKVLADQVEKTRKVPLQTGEQMEYFDTKDNLLIDYQKEMEKYVKGLISEKPVARDSNFSIKALVKDKSVLDLKKYKRQLGRIREMFALPLAEITEQRPLRQGLLINGYEKEKQDSN